jgi:signal transduction histidine kinase
VKLPLATRLVISYLAVILTGMTVVTPLAWLAVEQLYLNTQRASLLAQAQLVAAALQSSPPSTPDTTTYSQTMNTLPGIHTRVLDAQSAVVIDLPPGGLVNNAGLLTLPQLAQDAANPVSPDELLQREEIVQARAGKAATAVRSVQIAGGKPVLYAAAPVLAADGSVTQIVYLATPLPDTRFTALPESVRWLFGGVFLAAVLLAVLVGLLLARQVARPLGQLAEAARAVAAGNLAQSVPEDGGIRELAVLGQAFNHMTANLRQSDQAKTAFISDVTHELRTPLTVIKGMIETLQDGAINDLEARGPFLLSMGRETERLIRLVNDLLVLTRVDAGVLNLQRHPLDFEELVRTRCRVFAPLAAQRQVGLVVTTAWPVVEGQDGPAVVLADADRMAQVINNLLDNALRYAPAGSEVTLALALEAGQVICNVSDAGPGMAARHLPLIFERFYRVDSGRSRGQGGSGLGLSIVRSLVQVHGGEVSASSQEGRGTTITLRLPLMQS